MTQRMRFKIERTALWDAAVPPCPEAVKGTIPVWDMRTFKSPDEHDAKLGGRNGKWHDNGADHQVVYGPRGGVEGIKRRMPDRAAWFVEIDSLADLMAFHAKYGTLVLKSAMEDDATPTIEIYDDYRE